MPFLSSIFLIIAILLFQVTWGFYYFLMGAAVKNRPEWFDLPFLGFFPFLSGFVFPIWCWWYLTHVDWKILTGFNFALTVVAGIFISDFFKSRVVTVARPTRFFGTLFFGSLLVFLVGLTLV